MFTFFKHMFIFFGLCEIGCISGVNVRQSLSKKKKKLRAFPKEMSKKNK
jgi:hypothetical protein